VRIVFRPAPGAARVGFDQVLADGDTVRYEPVSEWRPTAAQLASFAGTYGSDEADGTMTVTAREGGLTMRDAAGTQVNLAPVYENTFSAGGATIRFGRDRAGKVSHLEAVSDRVWSLRFDRRP
jgi:hypothetical protein